MPTKYGPRHKVPFRRRREAKTDYRYRLRLLKSRLPRAVVRKSLKHTIVQLIEYKPDGDLVLTSATSQELLKLGWTGDTSNIPAAYLTGLLAGKRATEKSIKYAVLDIGLYPPIKGSRIFASLQGLVDAGLSLPHGEDIFPDEDRLKGKHILENKIEEFEKIKNKIIEDFGKAKKKNE